MIVTGASALPSTRSGRGPGRISSPTVGPGASGAEARNKAAATRAPVETTNSRRVMRKGVPLKLGQNRTFGSLTGQLWQCGDGQNRAGGHVRLTAAPRRDRKST